MAECDMRAWLVILLALLSGCDTNNERSPQTMSVPLILELQLGENMQSLLSRSPVKLYADCLKATDSCFHEFSYSANSANLPSVVIRHNGQALALQHVTRFMTSSNLQASTAMESFDMTIRGLPDDSTHEENQSFIYSIISTIKAAGWKRYISPSSPRISGAQAANITSPDEVAGLHVFSHPWFDPDHTMSMEQWLKAGSFYSWYFYNPGAHLKLTAWRIDTKTASATHGNYLVSLEFQADDYYWRYGFDTKEEQANWKKLLPAELRKYAELRAENEARLRAAGIEIDESYQNPPIEGVEPILMPAGETP
ncbi:hypothetical protein D9M70_287930 [compost metagenome]